MTALMIRQHIVHYEVLGRGRPLILLHGWVGSWRDWLPTMQALSSSYRCYALDLWGYGDTSHSPDRYTLQHQVELLMEFISVLGIGKIALLGHGLGAVVAAQFTATHSERVDRLMLVGYPHSTADIHSRFLTDSPEDLFRWLQNGVPGIEVLQREALKMDSTALQTALQDLKTEQLQGTLHQPALPRLFVFGDDDPSVNRPGPEALADAAYQTHYFLLESGGYAPMIRIPEKFCRLLNDFLSLSPEETPKKLQLKEEWKRRFR